MWVVICTYTVSALSLWTYTYGRESLRVSARGSFDSQCLEVIRDRGEVAGWCVATATANQRPKKNFPLCAPIFSPSRSLSSLSPLPCCLSLFLHLFFLRSFIRLVSFSTLSSRAKVCLALALKSSLSLTLSLFLSLALSLYPAMGESACSQEIMYAATRRIIYEYIYWMRPVHPVPPRGTLLDLSTHPSSPSWACGFRHPCVA